MLDTLAARATAVTADGEQGAAQDGGQCTGSLSLPKHQPGVFHIWAPQNTSRGICPPTPYNKFPPSSLFPFLTQEMCHGVSGLP